MINRAIIIVLDSVGCGATPDAARYGDEGTNTLAHIADHMDGLHLPNLAAMGLGNISQIRGVPAATSPTAAYGKMQEVSAGKDTTTGHWEIAGLKTEEPFRTFPQGFSPSIIDEFAQATGRSVVGNYPASGTEIIEELGPHHMRTGDWIVYTSADSVFQIAAHEHTIPLDELYRACEIARRILDPFMVGRVIARPFIGKPGSFERTYNRHDYGMPPTEPIFMEHLQADELPVIGVGKISDIFCGVGIDQSIRSAGNDDGVDKTIEQLRKLDRGLIFTNLIDFDALYGHRRDPAGYAAALERFDQRLAEIIPLIETSDLLLLTADHGNDPTHVGTDHTREYVPLLAYGPPSAAGTCLGTRHGFFDLAQTVVEAFESDPTKNGTSFWKDIS